MFEKLIPEEKSEYIVTMFNSLLCGLLVAFSGKLGLDAASVGIGCGALMGSAGAYGYQRVAKVRAEIPPRPMNVMTGIPDHSSER